MQEMIKRLESDWLRIVEDISQMPDKKAAYGMMKDLYESLHPGGPTYEEAVEQRAREMGIDTTRNSSDQ